MTALFCIAPLDTGRPCASPALLWDHYRGGFVCETHAPATEPYRRQPAALPSSRPAAPPRVRGSSRPGGRAALLRNEQDVGEIAARFALDADRLAARNAYPDGS